LAGVRKQNCSSFASFGFERWLVGLANVLQCGWGFFLLFLRGRMLEIPLKPLLHIAFVGHWHCYLC